MLDRLVTNLPTRPIGRVLGHGLYLGDRRARRTVRRNLAFAFPELSPAAVRARSRRVFANYGTTLVEILQLGFMTPADVERRIRLYGLKHFRDAYVQHRGVIAVSAHIGNWELGVQAMPCMFDGKVTAVAKRFKNNRFERWLHHIRTGDSVRQPGSIHLWSPGEIPQSEFACAENNALHTVNAFEECAVQEHNLAIHPECVRPAGSIKSQVHSNPLIG